MSPLTTESLRPPRILVVGECAPRGGDPLSLDGMSGRRLAELLNGLTYETRNLCEREWDDVAARAEWRRIRGEIAGKRVTVILLGRRVSRAAGLARMDLLTWGNMWADESDQYGVRVGLLPHPSGRNRWWNDPDNQEAARRFLCAV